MKTLKEFITEAKKSGVDKYPTGLHRDQDTGYEFDDAEAIANAGPSPSIEDMMKKAMSGTKYRRFIPKGTDMTIHPDKTPPKVVKLYQVKEKKKK